MSGFIEEAYQNEADDYVALNGGDQSGLEDFSNGFYAGVEAAEDHYGIGGTVVSLEGLRDLPMGSVISNEKERIAFKTRYSGWRLVDGSTVSNAGITLPASILIVPHDV